MELKTLADIEFEHEWNEAEKPLAVWSDDLRAEAIKWVKKDIEDWNAPGGLFQSEIIKRWKERFNITKEDLK